MYRGGMKESGIGRENGIEAYESCESAVECLVRQSLTSTVYVRLAI